jgi:UDP-N-acetylglucosamine acyltransferase
MANIHPTAIVDPSARVGQDVQIGPYCVIEPDVEIGDGSVLGPHVVIRRHTTLGRGNAVDPFTVLGGAPQDLKFDPATVSYLRIGDHNVFREGVTISRATGAGNETRVGSNTYWMAYSHAGHNATIGDGVILVNGSAVAGHSTIGAGTILSANVLVHQFCWVGELVMSQGNSGVGMHVPPYTMFAGVNQVVGLNSVGLRRSTNLTGDDRRQIKEAFSITYHSHLTPAKALEKMDQCADWGKPADAFRQFVRRVLSAERPFNRGLLRSRRQAEAGAD